MAEDGRHHGEESSFAQAHEYEELDQKEPHPVQDSTEAEHMAHAMDPHYTRAREIEALRGESHDSMVSQHEKEDEDWVTDEEAAGDPVLDAHAGEESLAGLTRDVAIGDEMIALDQAASKARKAGDAAGEIASSVYRRKKAADSTDDEAAGHEG